MVQLVLELRQWLGLTQEKFAAKLGVTSPSVNRWENEHAKPSPLALKQIEDLLREMGAGGSDLLAEYFAAGCFSSSCYSAAAQRMTRCRLPRGL